MSERWLDLSPCGCTVDGLAEVARLCRKVGAALLLVDRDRRKINRGRLVTNRKTSNQIMYNADYLSVSLRRFKGRFGAKASKHLILNWEVLRS